MTERIIILTGGIGSGKSTAGKMLADLGVTVIDADDIAKSVTAPGAEAIEPIRQVFGSAFIASDGSLNRDLMRSEVFGKPQSRIRLEEIIHPLVRQKAMHLLRQAKGPYAVYMVPLWTEQSALGKEVLVSRPEKIVVVDCDPQAQIQRVMARSKLSRDEVQAMLHAQASRKDRLRLADVVLHNDGSIEELRQQVQTLHQTLIQP